MEHSNGAKKKRDKFVVARNASLVPMDFAPFTPFSADHRATTATAKCVACRSQFLRWLCHLCALFPVYIFCHCRCCDVFHTRFWLGRCCCRRRRLCWQCARPLSDWMRNNKYDKYKTQINMPNRNGVADLLTNDGCHSDGKRKWRKSGGKRRMCGDFLTENS